MRYLVVTLVLIPLLAVSRAQDNWNTPTEPFRIIDDRKLTSADLQR